MKSIKMALLGGAALAVTAAGAQADDLEALKAQIEELNSRVAAMEAAPAVPTGYQLVAISKGELQETPGLELRARERANYGNRSTIISVLPTADAPAGAVISWSGYARAGLVYETNDWSIDVEQRSEDDEDWNDIGSASSDSDDEGDIDVYARGQLRVKASTDTAVGEVGVDMRIRANFDGVESEGSDFYMDVAWGYWAMTPELTFGGGYAGSLGEVPYSFDASCTCHYIDTVGFNPGDTSQMRLSYASGPFSMAIAVEDGSLASDSKGLLVTADDLDAGTEDALGVAGALKYSGDTFSGAVVGMWRDIDNSDFTDLEDEFLPSSWWQVGGGLSFGLMEVATFNIAAAIGEGPVEAVDDDFDDDFSVPWNNSWWGVSGLVSFNLTDEFHAEIGAGYTSRDFDDVDLADGVLNDDMDPKDIADPAEWSAESDRWVVGGGLYYEPVDQLTIGVEASYADTQVDIEENSEDVDQKDTRADFENQSLVVDFVGVWRF